MRTFQTCCFCSSKRCHVLCTSWRVKLLCFYHLADVDTETFYSAMCRGTHVRSDGGRKTTSYPSINVTRPTTQDRAKIFSSILTIVPEESVPRLCWPELLLYFHPGAVASPSSLSTHPQAFSLCLLINRCKKMKVSSRHRNSLKLSGK